MKNSGCRGRLAPDGLNCYRYILGTVSFRYFPSGCCRKNLRAVNGPFKDYFTLRPSLTGSRPSDGRRLKITILSARQARENTERTLHSQEWICNSYSSIEPKSFVLVQPIEVGHARVDMLTARGVTNRCGHQQPEHVPMRRLSGTSTWISGRIFLISLKQPMHQLQHTSSSLSSFFIRIHHLSPHLPSLRDFQEQRTIDVRHVRTVTTVVYPSVVSYRTIMVGFAP